MCIRDSLSIAVVSRRTLTAHIPIVRRCHVTAAHAIEARPSETSVRIVAGRSVAREAGIACAAVPTGAIMVACGVHRTIVLVEIAWPNLLARRLIGKQIPIGTRARVRVCSNVGAIAGATWVPSAVVDIQARLSITAEARRARIASEPFRRCWHIVTCHALEARRSSTAIGVITLGSAPGEAALACAAVTTRTLMTAGRVQCTVVLAPVSYTHLRAHETLRDRGWRGGG